MLRRGSSGNFGLGAVIAATAVMTAGAETDAAPPHGRSEPFTAALASQWVAPTISRISLEKLTGFRPLERIERRRKESAKMELFLEDFQPGQTFTSGEMAVELEEVLRFASEYDPQAHHLDETAAKASPFRGLAASGWHTAAMTTRLLVESDMRPAGGIVGGGIDELRWPRPVRPGDTLHLESEVLDVRPSLSRPGQGVVRLRTTTLNQDNQPVQTMIGNLIVKARQ